MKFGWHRSLNLWTDPISDNPEKYLKPVGECLIWQRAKTPAGYGVFWKDGKLIYAHIYFYEKKYGKVTPGAVLDHIKCNTPPCCNADHMRESTRGKNAGRFWAEKTHCPKGHEYTPANTRIGKYGKRYCRQCRKEYGK